MMPFSATWMTLENITLSEEVRQTKILYIIYIWNFLNNTNKCMCKNTSRPTDIEDKGQRMRKGTN